MVSKCVIFGAFLFLVWCNFLFSGGVFNKTIIPFALVVYKIGYSQLGPTGLVGYLPSHIQRATWNNIVNYVEPFMINTWR